ncbi:MAG TPA: hypothetical protein VII30_01500 [Gemmatimonadaceae bacterium]
MSTAVEQHVTSWTEVVAAAPRQCPDRGENIFGSTGMLVRTSLRSSRRASFNAPDRSTKRQVPRLFRAPALTVLDGTAASQ